MDEGIMVECDENANRRTFVIYSDPTNYLDVIQELLNNAKQIIAYTIDDNTVGIYC